mmetsp:Transcript_91752/g.168334  ORF Transcript_91752/g.168334 Transcript_91752/m.168334 type:complete len:189 (-) Transcript_91752:111-677(-)
MQQCRLPAIMLICVMMLKVFTSTHAGSKDARRLMREQRHTSFSIGSRGTFAGERTPGDDIDESGESGVPESTDKAMHAGEHSEEDTPAEHLCPDEKQPKYFCPRDDKKSLQDQDWNCMLGLADGQHYGSDHQEGDKGHEEHERACCCHQQDPTVNNSCWLCECVPPQTGGGCGTSACQIGHSIKECFR